MKMTLSLADFLQFSESYRNTFSYEGKEALFNYLCDLEEGAGEEIEFDWVAFSCDFTEYESEEELRADYNIKEESIEDWEGFIARLSKGGILARNI